MPVPNLNFSIIAYGSEAYHAARALRYEVMRKPLGLEFTPAEDALDLEATHFAAFDGSQLVGCVMGQPINDAIKIRQMVVHPDYAGRGIGRLLLQSLEAYYRSKNITHYNMHARDSAVGFYEKLGYQISGEPFEEVGILHRKLEKTIA